MVGPARHFWGIVSDRSPKDAAEAEANALVEASLPALALPSGRLEDAPDPAPAARLGWSAAELAKDGGNLLPWAGVKLLAPAAFRETTVKQISVAEAPDPSKRALKFGLAMATGIPIPLGGGGSVSKSVEETELGFYLDIILGEPAERWRVNAQHFDFSCLGAVKGLGVLDNFRTLVLELCRLAPGAVRNRGAAILLNSRPMREMGYDGLSDLDRECRWLLTLSAIGRL